MDEITTGPDFQGASAAAWRMVRPYEGRWTGAWLIETLCLHAGSDSFVVALTGPDVRDWGTPFHPGATHEMFVTKIDPMGDRQHALDEGHFCVRCRISLDVFLCVQIGRYNDKQAYELVEGFVRGVCTGTLTPYGDMAPWIAKLDMQKT